jgi:hypothetical protein
LLFPLGAAGGRCGRLPDHPESRALHGRSRNKVGLQRNPERRSFQTIWNAKNLFPVLLRLSSLWSRVFIIPHAYRAVGGTVALDGDSIEDALGIVN